MATITTFLFTLTLAASVNSMNIRIDPLNFAYSGNGCPQGSVSIQGDAGLTSPCGDRPCAGDGSKLAVSKIFTQKFDRFNIYWGPGTSTSDRSKTCQTSSRYDFGGVCGKLVVNSNGMDVRGYTSQSLSDASVSANVAYYDSGDAAILARNNLTLPEGSSGAALELGYTGSKHTDGTSLTTKCSRGGTLNMNYRIAATDLCATCGESGDTDNFATAGQWYFQHSLAAIECECT